MNKYDLHIHTVYSPCSINKPKTILKLAKKSNLTGIAITDHQEIKGALKTKSLNKDKNLKVLVGEEVHTNYGDVLALDIQKKITKIEFFEVLDEIKSQDAIMVIAHPFRITPWLKFKYPLEKLVGKVPAVEVFNSRNIGLGNIKSKRIVKNLDFAQIGSSDAHIPLDIGKAYTIFEGDLRKAIKKRKTIAKGTTLYGLPSALLSAINKRILFPIGAKKRWT
jgi:predicted metal-dependent phosphoesterase TrpH